MKDTRVLDCLNVFIDVTRNIISFFRNWTRAKIWFTKIKSLIHLHACMHVSCFIIQLTLNESISIIAIL